MAHFLSYKLVVLVLNIVSCQCQMQVVARDEESCKFNFSQGQLVINDDNRIISTPGQPATLQNGTKLHIKCLKGYSLEVMTDEGFLKGADLSSGTSICQSGFWKPTYECSAESCTLKEYPTNEFTKISRQRDGEFYSVSIDDDMIAHGDSIEYSCQSEEYELYVAANDTYLTHFSSTCHNGTFSSSKQEFPLCQARGCDFHVNDNVSYICYMVSNISEDVCRDDDFRIQSGSSFSMKCNDGFELFRETDQTYTGEERMTLTCDKGKHAPEYLCKPKRCILPEMSNATTQESTLVISINGSFVESGQSINISCEQGYQIVGSSIVECIKGEWTKEFPVCWQEPCEFNFSEGQLVSNEDNTIVSTPGLQATFQNGTKLYIKCLERYSLEIMTDDGIIEGASLAKGTAICQSGVFKPIYQCSAECTLSSDNSFIYKTLDGVEVDPGSFINHGTKINIYCRNEGFESDYYPYEGVDADSFSQIDCINGRLGQISLNCRNGDPETCNVLANGFVEKGLKNEYKVSCNKGYNLNLMRPDKPYCECQDGHLVCQNGDQKDMSPKCESGCKIPSDGPFLYKTQDGDYVYPGSFINNGTRLEIYCRYVELGDYSYDNGVDNDVMHIDCLNGQLGHINLKCKEGCRLPSDDLFLYKTQDGDNVDPGSLINHGTRLEIYCRYVDLGDYSYDSGVDNDVIHIDCFNGQLGHINLKCKEGDPEKCTTLANGSVKRRFLNEYEVSCNEGYALNLLRPDLPYCECRDDRLVCQYGGQTPKCEPEPCKIPYTFDDRLAIFIRRGGNIISLSGGVTVQIGETLFFNCINTEFDNLEPNNRRFKCTNGKWLEDEKDKTWQLGNKGDFPTCRNTSCLPECKNGGKCIRDGICQCPHLTSGRSCEDVLCDEDCKKNGGTCIAPGQCGMCPIGQSGQNCQHHGCPPPVEAPTIKSPKVVYNIGETIESAQFVCTTNHVLKPENGMTCSSEGWTEAAKCLPKIKYVIQIKTGPGILAGTSNSIYVILHGEKYSTELLHVPGWYNMNGLDEQSISSIDVTPVKRITVIKKHDWYQNDWQMDYVSIFVEKNNIDDQFYVFDANNKWINDTSGIDLELSLWPEQCVHIFQRQGDLHPKKDYTKQFRLGMGHDVSERTCKQLCAKYKQNKCNGVHFLKAYNDCWGLEDTNARYFERQSDTYYFKRLCLK